MCSELAVVKELLPSLGLAETQGQAGQWDSFLEEKGLRAALMGAVGLEKLEVPSLGGGVPCDWLGERVRLSLVGPELEAGTEIREAVSYQPNSGLLGLIVAGVIV